MTTPPDIPESPPLSAVSPPEAPFPPALVDYALSQDGLVLLPIEALGPDGLHPGFAAALRERGVFDEAWLALFDEAYRAYFARARVLHEAAPRHWFPPRVQHVCIVTAPDVIRPYFQPFHRNSWLLYASDFDPATSSVELGAYQLLHVERMALLQELEPVLVTNLCYLLVLSDAQLADFEAGCRRCARPDAAAFHALAEALPWVRTLHHLDLHPPREDLAEAAVLPGTGLILQPADHAPLQALQEVWLRAANACFERHHAAHALPAPTAGARVCDWLAETAPPLLVTGEDWAILWDPEQPEDTDALRKALTDVTASGEAGILADLQVIDRNSRRFLGALLAPEALVDPAPYITEGGLSYIHKERKLIAYHVGPGDNAGRLWQPAPPFERFMLAARTIHEWGHLAAESGWIPVPEHRSAERDAAREELVALLEEIYEAAPEPVRDRSAAEVTEMRAKHGSFGKALLKRMNVRIEDYEANLLARRFLHPDEMDTYVRNNVAWQAPEQGASAIYHQLTRHAYEVQYLGLSRIPDPLGWLLKSTWFEERFLRTGVVTLAQFEKLVAQIAAICACYEIDETKFDLNTLHPS
jgi:hypothetical protein